MSRMIVLFTFLGASLLGGACLHAQEKPTEVRAARKIALGRSLFRSDLLSGREGMNCASCHEPELSFADGQVESPGILGIGVGRNSPALWAVAAVESFPGPDLAARDPFAVTRALSLAERCLVPIENPLEMASSVSEALERINASKPLGLAFDQAFGRILGKVRADHLGEALVAYLASLSPPPSPYRAYLDGDREALRPIEREGLRVFNGRGQCAGCHSGAALSDGLVHAAFTDDSERARRQAERQDDLRQDLARELQRQDDFELPRTGIGQAFLARLRPTPTAGCEPGMTAPTRTQGGYDGGGPPPFPQLQTLSLWDVKRTGPYFRDGSEPRLDEALVRHVAELREVSGRREELRRRHRQALRASRGRARPALLPAWLDRDQGAPPTPARLGPGDLRALEAFLGALSPRDG